MASRTLLELTLMRNTDGSLDYVYLGNPRERTTKLCLRHFIEEQYIDPLEDPILKMLLDNHDDGKRH